MREADSSGSGACSSWGEDELAGAGVWGGAAEGRAKEAELEGAARRVSAGACRVAAPTSCNLSAGCARVRSL